MKHLFAHPTQKLGAAIVLALVSVGAQAQTAQPLAPPVAQPLAVPTAAPAPLNTAPIAPPAVGQINQAPYNYGASAPAVDESTLLSQVGREQARITLLTLQAKTEQTRLGMERERMKFQEEQQEAQSKAAAAVVAQNAARGLSASGQKVEEKEPEIKPSVRSIYSFDGKWFAEIMVDGNKVLASPGTVLINGGKVATITPSNVVVMNKGKRQVLPLDGSAALSGQSIAPSFNSTPSAPVQAPSSLPPIPPATR